jgi:tetratricopeptide (TPR) repeat protein
MVLIAALIWPHSVHGAQQKAKRQAAAPASPSSAPVEVTDLNLLESFKAGQDQLKKGRTDDALRIFHAIYSYAGDSLKLMACVREAYEKAQNDPSVAQNQKETLYLRLQRISALSAGYTKLKGESAYNLGLAYSKKGNAAQARGYLLEACRATPFSLDPDSVWMKSKNLFLSISNLDGEF